MDHRVVSHDEWLSARRTLLQKEKEFTRQGDELIRQVRELPWEAVTKEYVFEGYDGTETLPDLFAGTEASLWCITLCFIRTTKPDALTFHCAPTASTASSRTSISGT